MPPNIAHDALEMVEYRDIPALLILADDEAAGERARLSAERGAASPTSGSRFQAFASRRRSRQRQRSAG